MYNTDFTKMFDPQAMSKSMQQFFDFNSALTNSKQNADCFKKLSSIWSDTYSTCAEKQLKLCQSAMEESAECLRDLSSCKGVEEYVSKQTEWSKRLADKCQSGAQDIATCVQKGQTQSTDIISKMLGQSTEWAKTMSSTWNTTTANNTK